MAVAGVPGQSPCFFLILGGFVRSACITSTVIVNIVLFRVEAGR
jgi:hypothetical protein